MIVSFGIVKRNGFPRQDAMFRFPSWIGVSLLVSCFHVSDVFICVLFFSHKLEVIVARGKRKPCPTEYELIILSQSTKAPIHCESEELSTQNKWSIDSLVLCSKNTMNHTNKMFLSQ